MQDNQSKLLKKKKFDFSLVAVLNSQQDVIIIIIIKKYLREKSKSFLPREEVKEPNAPFLCQAWEATTGKGWEQQSNFVPN